MKGNIKTHTTKLIITMIKQIFDYLTTNNFEYSQIPNYGLAPDIFGLGFAWYIRQIGTNG